VCRDGGLNRGKYYSHPFKVVFGVATGFGILLKAEVAGKVPFYLDEVLLFTFLFCEYECLRA